MNPSDVGQFSAIFYTQQRAQAELMSLSSPIDPKSKIKTTSRFFGYRNKEDYTNLPQGFLIPPSRNVFINTNGLIQTRLGYIPDGQTDTTNAPILGSYDWFRGIAGEGHVRFANGKLQSRYVANAGDSWDGIDFSEGQVYWIDILSGITADHFEFSEFFNNSELLDVLLGVKGDSQIMEWGGGIAVWQSASNAAGNVNSVAVNLVNAGNGYAVGDALTISGGGGNATLLITGIQTGGLGTLGIGYGGINYQVGDVLSVGGGMGGNVTVSSVNGSGTITGISVSSIGQGYTIPVTAGVAVYGGHGSGAWLSIVSVLSNYVSTVSITSGGSGYSVANGNATTTNGSGSGCQIDILSISSNSISVKGNLTLAQLGFYTQSSTVNKTINVNGTVYSYTSIFNNAFVGVSPDPVVNSQAVGSVIFQCPTFTANSSMTTLPSTFVNDTIRTLNNQVYVGSYSSNTVYKSKINSYTDYSQGSPRLPGDGYTWTLDGPLRGISPQESTMYASWGHGGWTTLVFNDNLDTSAGTATETATITTLKTGVLQAALSQALMVSIGNDLAFVTNEPTLTTMGRIANNFGIPQMMNISDPIKNDFDNYGTESFANGHAIYWNYYLWVSVPQKGIILRYNIAKSWWEPPQYIPVGRFAIINGQLYGHSASSPQTYQLETGTNDNGNPMDAIAAFSYDQMGLRYGLKNFTDFGIEGYISSNTTLYLMTKLDFGGFSGSPTYTINGNDFAILFQTIADGSLGKNPIGEQPIGSITDSPSSLAKFRVIKTGVPINFFEYQPYFESNDIDQQWQILSFGPEVVPGPEPSNIKE